MKKTLPNGCNSNGRYFFSPSFTGSERIFSGTISSNKSFWTSHHLSFRSDGILPLTRHYFLKSLRISPIQNTTDVLPIIIAQSISFKTVTLNISPPNVTISHCPPMMIKATNKNPPLLSSEANADFSLINALALNMFQNCSITKMVKNNESS